MTSYLSAGALWVIYKCLPKGYITHADCGAILEMGREDARYIFNMLKESAHESLSSWGKYTNGKIFFHLNNNEIIKLTDKLKKTERWRKENDGNA